MNKKSSKKSKDPAPSNVVPIDSVNQLVNTESYSAILMPVLTPETIEDYVPTSSELELIEKNRREVSMAMSGDGRSALKPKQEETKDQRRAFLIWYRQHLSGLFKAEQVDAAVAKVLKVEIGTIRRWKTIFGWAKRLDTLKKEEKAEEQVLLYAKNEEIEQESLNILLRYLNHIKSLAPADIMPGHVSMMMKLVDFSQKNKDKMNPPSDTMSASGVSLTIHQD